jgi:phytoene dehydrogenase-like protein
MKQPVDEHEIIVLGSGLGGLITAALLSYHNHNVLFLKENQYHPFYGKDGYHFVPFSNFSERRVKLSLLEKISYALNLPFLPSDQKERRKVETKLERPKQRVAFQVILPKSRIDLFSHRPMFRMEWKRAFPKEVAPIENFYHEMDRIQHLLNKMKIQESSWSKFPVRQPSLIKRWFSFRSLPMGNMDKRLSLFSKEFREFIRLQLMSWGSLQPYQLPVSLATYLLLNGEGEDWANVELERVEKSIFEKLIQSGGRVEEIEGVERVDISWRRRFTLKLKGETRPIRSKFLIINSPLHRLSSLLGRKERLLSKWRERIQPRYALLPIFLGIDEKVVPVGMNDLVVSMFDLEKPYGGGNVLFLALSKKGDEAAAPEGKRALIVQSLMPLERGDQTSLDKSLEGIMKHLHHLFPFLENYIEFTDGSWADGQFLRWSYPHFIYETTRDFKWGKGVVPARISKNLYFVGKENFPYLGLEGEIHSGWMVAKEILKQYHG